MNYITEAIRYVYSDPSFWMAMSLTTSIGIFIGAVIYDGLLTEAKKGIVVLLSYSSILIISNASRIIPVLTAGKGITIYQPFAGIATIFFVSIFYTLGMYAGVKITSHAHGGKHDERRQVIK